MIEAGNIEDILARLTAEEREDVMRLAEEELKKPFIPNPGPQTEALHSRADILLYGGQAGGGKTALEVGCPALNHREGIIFRREATQLDGIVNFSQDVLGSIGEYNKVEKLWTFDDGKHLKFAGLNAPDDWRKYAGNPRDYMAFDEAGEFLKQQVFSLLGWLRTTVEGQRCRMILGSNPPRGGDGAWMVEEFSPWLAPQSGIKAKAGELLWTIMVEGKTEWVEGPGVYVRNGEEYEALSRTFIPASLSDNQYLTTDTAYRSRLQSLPEPLRSQLLYGDFTAGVEDNDYQVIPTQWIRDAQNRWTSEPPDHAPMSCLAVDPAQGGADTTSISARYDAWFAPIKQVPGKDTPTGNEVAGLVIAERRNAATVVVDMGGGYGGATKLRLEDNMVEVTGHKGAEKSVRRSEDKQFAFVNKRSESYWRLREALDPSQDGGSFVALPDDPELVADLTAPTFEITAQGIKVLPKEKVVAKLGRSPDKGDAVTMANMYGPKLMTHGNQWRKFRDEANGKTINVNQAHQAARRRR